MRQVCGCNILEILLTFFYFSSVEIILFPTAFITVDSLLFFISNRSIHNEPIIMISSTSSLKIGLFHFLIISDVLRS